MKKDLTLQYSSPEEIKQFQEQQLGKVLRYLKKTLDFISAFSIAKKSILIKFILSMICNKYLLQPRVIYKNLMTISFAFLVKKFATTSQPPEH